MVRIPVPDDYERGYIDVSGRKDTHYGTPDAHVEVEDRDHCRNLQVREDEDGRYVGCSDDIASAVAEFLGVDADDPATCQVEKADGEICGRQKPCPYHSEGDDG